jgi:membrane dipeptidase
MRMAHYNRGMLRTTPVLALSGLLAMTMAMPTAQTDPQLDRARRLLREQPVIDGHNDYPWAVRENVKGDVDALNIRGPQPSIMTDLPRLAAGGVGGQFWSVYVPSPKPAENPAESVIAALEQIDIVHRMMAKYPDKFALALTAGDIERIQKEGRIASLIGMEGGHSINSSLAVLRDMYRLGARYMTLTHSLNVPWADSATDTPAHNGLTPFGESVIREMNRLGMLVDLSHVSPATMAAAMKVSTAPVIFSHSSSRAVTNVPRNVPDDMLRALAQNGGVVMVTFVPGFVSETVAAYNRTEDAERARLAPGLNNDTAAIDKAIEEWRKTHPRQRATLKDVADHIDHIKQVAGIDHIGVGGDFDGITSVVQGLEDVSTYPALFAELLRRGYGDDDIKKIAGRNILRVLRGAEAAARLQKGS